MQRERAGVGEPRAASVTLATGGTLVCMPGVAHCPQWEQPERVAEELVALLRRPGARA